MSLSINPSVSTFPHKSLANIYRNQQVITINPKRTYNEIRTPSVLNNYVSTTNTAVLYQLGFETVEGILKTDKDEIVPYATIYLYSTTSGVLVTKTSTDAEGRYKFNYLRSGTSYMLVSYDKTLVNNATIVDFTVKQS